MGRLWAGCYAGFSALPPIPQDTIISAVLAIGYFSGGVALLVYAQDWFDLADDATVIEDELNETGEACQAAGVGP